MRKILDYDSANDFCEGMASVWRGNKSGYIDKTGQMVIEYHTESAPAPAKFDAPDEELPF